MDSEYKPYSINVYPPIDIINKAFIDVMFFLNWTKVAIIYEEDQGNIIMPTGLFIYIMHVMTSKSFFCKPNSHKEIRYPYRFSSLSVENKNKAKSKSTQWD